MNFIKLIPAILLLTGAAQADSPATKKPIPKTLLSFAGFTRPALNMKTTALLIIDAQQEYSKGRLPISGWRDSSKKIAELIRFFRSKSGHVIFIFQDGRKGGLFDPETDLFQPISGTEPVAAEPVIRKKFPNAFQGTALEEKLSKAGIKTLVLTGYMTHMCVSSTARSAIDHGFMSIIVPDATGTRDLEGTSGETIPSATVHSVALSELKDRFGWILPSQELIREFDR